MNVKQSLKPIVAKVFDFDDDIFALQEKIRIAKEDANVKDDLIKNIMESDATKSEKIKSLEQILSFIESEKKF